MSDCIIVEYVYLMCIRLFFLKTKYFGVLAENVKVINNEYRILWYKSKQK